MSKEKPKTAIDKAREAIEKIKQEDKPPVIAPKIEEVVKKESTRKMGRPSEKNPDIEYVKLSARIPADTRKRLKIALADRFEKEFKTQDEIVNFALLYFLDNYK